MNEKRDLCSKPQRSSLSQGHWCVVFPEINQCFNQVQISCISLEISYRDLNRKKVSAKGCPGEEQIKFSFCVTI